MLSTRGSLTIDAALNECIGRTSSSHTGRVLPLTEAQQVWSAIGSLVHTQMLLGHPITIPKFCSFWCKQRHVATQGNIRFYVRELCVGFTQAFVTMYNLDPSVPLEDPRLKYIKLPLDIVSQEARVPADICASILRELTLFVGEGCFRGKSFQLSFPTVADVQLKKERAHVAPCPALVTELFTIDSRKWPADVRDMAAAQVFRPRSSLSSAATRSGSSRPNTARTQSAAGGSRPSTSATAAESSALQNRPMFVTALKHNKTFAEIEALPVREVRHKPRLPGAKGRATSAHSTTAAAGASSASPLAHSRHVDPLDANQMALEEESVYDVLSPSRQLAAAMNRRAQQRQQQQHTYPSHADQQYDVDDEGEVGETVDSWRALNPMPAAIPQSALLTSSDEQRFPLTDRTNRTNNNTNLAAAASSSVTSVVTPTGVPSCCKRIKAVFPWETALPERGDEAEHEAGMHLRHGRRHYGDHNNNAATGSALYEAMDERPSTSGAAFAVPRNPLYGKKRLVHPAAGQSIKELLYDNMAHR